MGNCNSLSNESAFDMLVGAKSVESEILAASPLSTTSAARPKTATNGPGEEYDRVVDGSPSTASESEASVAEEELRQETTSAVRLGVSRLITVFRLQSGDKAVFQQRTSSSTISSLSAVASSPMPCPSSRGPSRTAAMQMIGNHDVDAAATTLSPPARLSRDVLVGAPSSSPRRRLSVVAKTRLFEEVTSASKSEADDAGVAEGTRKWVVVVATFLLSLFVLNSSIFLLVGSVGGHSPFGGRLVEEEDARVVLNDDHDKGPIVEDVRRRRKQISFGRYVDIRQE